MSRRGIFAAALCLAAGTPCVAAGQSIPVLRDRVQRLETLHRAALRARERADSVRTSAMDTVREGVLTVLAPRAAVPAAREAMRQVLPRILLAYGDAAAALSDTAPLPYRGARRPARMITFWDSSLNVDEAANTIARLAEAAVTPGRTHPSVTWSLHTFVAPFSREELANGLTAAYIELVTAPSPAAGACFDGDLGQCRIALNLVHVEDPATQWYGAAGRRALVQRFMGVRRRVPRSTLQLCVEGSDEACITSIRAFQRVEIIAPLGGATRLTLLRHVLANSGPGAYTRLVTSTADISGVLSSAAAAPLDTVLARWRATVIQARPTREGTTAGMGLVAILWATGLGALALKGTRWRRL